MKTLAFVFGDARKSLERVLRNSNTYDSWFSFEDPQEIAYDLGLSTHLGVQGLMVPGRIPDIEGARLIVGSFLHPAGLIAATVKHKFTLMCEHDPDTHRLRLVPDIHTPGVTHPAAKILLIYLATPYSSGSLSPKLGSKSTPTERDNWIKSILPQILRLEPVPDSALRLRIGFFFLYRL